MIEDIKTPDDLLTYMDNHIKYGFTNKNNKVFDGDDPSFEKEYALQSPEQIIKSGVGVCWDQVELERFWFKKQSYDFMTFFVYFKTPNDNDLPTHTFLVFNIDNSYYWFEHSFEEYKGIHKYDSLLTLLNDVINKTADFDIRNHMAKEEDLKYLTILKYNQPKYGCSSFEFINNIITE